jgi:hypothetical protein
VAGKISRGLGGKKEDAAPMLIADEPDMPGNSGPTVVDDAKVAEVLKKLRSLDVQSGPLGGVTEVVIDPGSSEPTRINPALIEIDSGPVEHVGSGVEKLLRPSQRTTAVGRSQATPAAGQAVTIPADLARGTLFGRSIHLPDVNSPDDEAIDLDSGAVAYLEGGPPPSQPFPLAENLVLPPPTSQPLPVYDAGSSSFESGLNTQLVAPPKSRAFVKAIAFLGGVGIIAAGFWAWQTHGKSETPTAAAPAAPEPAKPPPPLNDPMPPAPAAAAEPAAPAPTPSAAPSPTEAAPAPSPPKPEAAPAPDAPAKASASAGDEPTPPSRARESSRKHGRRSSGSAERHSGKTAAAPAAPAPPPDTSDAPEPAAKPSHGKKRGVDDDPDNTMAPSD